MSEQVEEAIAGGQPRKVYVHLAHEFPLVPGQFPAVEPLAGNVCSHCGVKYGDIQAGKTSGVCPVRMNTEPQPEPQS